MEKSQPETPRPDYKAKIRQDIYHFGKTGITKRLMTRQYNEYGQLKLSVLNISQN